MNNIKSPLEQICPFFFLWDINYFVHFFYPETILLSVVLEIELCWNT